ncbi:hypothetical protein [Flavobacterium sp. Sd200]|uniref:hypothetical protein n=1 Tax=Flavobacterium sp. Sd200 TaxID=2692211 RepID=UPI001F261AA2|nr:hypothetical protein [Flavobacterium sp. Sd200]
MEEADKAILEAISTFFLNLEDDEPVSNDIENSVKEYLEAFREDLYCLIEYPYVDKVYRDSYYSYYSSKHADYQRDSIRVSLFEPTVTGNEFLDPAQHGTLNKKYLGYFTIRPTLNSLFGRSLINPKAMLESDFKACLCKGESFVFGAKLQTEGFPHSAQDEETILCAETTIWGLMEYFSSRYPDYKPVLPSQIHSALKNLIFQRQLPSMGLSMDQISFALKEFGFGTRIYNQNPYSSGIYNLIDCYIESGIPVLIGLESDTIGHVIIGIGKEYDHTFDINTVKKTTFHSHGRDKEFLEHTNFPKRYVVQDDNLAPYRVIDIDNPGEHYPGSQGFDDMKVDSVIVPLYPKIYLEAELARKLFLELIKDEDVGFDFEDGFIFRYFLASSRSFKRHVSAIKEINTGLKFIIVSSKMPKFIWCGEIYSSESSAKEGDEPIGLIILDATEANKAGIDALLFAGYPDRCIRRDENNFVDLQGALEKYTYYSNLK